MKVIIVGAGFGGLRLARALNNKDGFEVTLLDRQNHHQFQPLFYQVATAGLDASNISFPLRRIFQKSRNVQIRLGELEEVLPNENKIRTNIGDMDYDVLVIATGATTNFFGNKEITENVFPMKSTAEALQLRHRLLQNFEDAVLVKSPEELQKLLTIVLVGGGPTGVELSGAIAEMQLFVLPKDYPEIDFSKMKIYLLEGSPKTLASMSAESSADSRNYLEKLGVTVMTGAHVTNYDGENVTLEGGQTIGTRLVIWAAGIKGNLPAGIDPSLVVKGNRITTDRFNRVKGSTSIYAIGDIGWMETPKYVHGHPQVASVAIQQAACLAKNLKELQSDGTLIHEFEYRDKGSMATVGRNLAVVDIPKPKLHFKGFFAWLIWMSLHLMLILGVKNRLFVFLNWLYNYATHDQSLRLLFREYYKPKKYDVIQL